MNNVVKSWRGRKNYKKYDTQPTSVGQPSKCRKKKNRHKVILNTCVDTYDMPSPCRTIEEVIQDLARLAQADDTLEHIIAVLSLIQLRSLSPEVIQQVETILSDVEDILDEHNHEEKKLCL